MKRFALALSHLPHVCCGSDLPIQNLVQAVQFIKKNRGILVTSCGSLSWNLQVSLASSYSVPMELVLPLSSDNFWDNDFFEKQFGKNKLIMRYFCGSDFERDQIVIEQADTVFPIWLRKKGNLIQHMRERKECQIEDRFRIDHFSIKHPVKYFPGEPSEEISTLPDNYLWHWTRQCDGPWPNETIQHYCLAIIDSELFPRSALNTLLRIVKSGKLISSGKLIHKNTPVISFTENHPSEMKSHFIWRTGRTRMNFEPYAIGFPKEIMQRMGAVPVKYNQPLSWDVVSSGLRWEKEREWRVRGDLSFSRQMIDSMIVIVRNEEERRHFLGKRVAVYEQ